MHDGDILVLKGKDVALLLKDRELELMDTVGRAYETHRAGASSLPHSVFLHFPDQPRSRIIALPAYLGQDFELAGVKWVSSFPSNLERGIDRASAVVVLNSASTGRPQAILEGSIINAKRTAASAALAAKYLQPAKRSTVLGVFGCGVINFEITRFVLRACEEITRVIVYDLDPERAKHFRENCRANFPRVTFELAGSVESLLKQSPLVSFATTAGVPHINDLSICPPDTTILHISLRDLSPEVILAADNVVDDADHVCRANTSLHLTEQQTGNRDFIRCPLADVLTGASPRRGGRRFTVFSPFGLGVLDVAVGKLLCDLALANGQGEWITSFFPEPWKA